MQESFPEKLYKMDESKATALRLVTHSEDENDLSIYTTASSNTSEYRDMLSNPNIRICLVVVHIICSILAILGNAIVLCVIYKRRSLRRNPTIIFIINLACIDLILTVFYRPLLLVKLLLPFTSSALTYYHNTAYCKAMAYFQNMFAAVGYHTIVAISQERLLLIVYPLKAKQCCSIGRARKLLVLVWMVAAATVLPVPLKYIEGLSFNVDGRTINYCGLRTTTIDGQIYFSLMLLLYYVIPFIIIAVSYSRIFFALYHRPKNVPKVHETKDFKTLRARRNLAKMMLSVAVVFSLCWGPNFFYYFYVGIGGDVPSDGFFIGVIVDILPIMGSALNPFVYTINSRTFRRGFSNMFRVSGRRKSGTESTMNTFGGYYQRQSTRSLAYEKNGQFGDAERKMSLIGNRAKGDVMM